MTHEEFNRIFREMCNDLIVDGCKKSKICKVTLGRNNQPMFEGFINKNKNFGIAVLQRIVENYGYDLMILPIKKDLIDEYQEFLDQTKQQFTDDLKEQIRESVENIQIHNTGRPNEQINNVVNSILDDLIGDANDENS